MVDKVFTSFASKWFAIGMRFDTVFVGDILHLIEEDDALSKLGLDLVVQ